MDVHEALRRRRTPHNFLPDGVPDEVLVRAVEAAHQAPNHKLTYPWRFWIPGPVTRGRIADVAIAAKREAAPLHEAQVASIRAPLADRGALVVVGQHQHADPFRAREDYAAVACAVMAFMLSAQGDGFSVKWGTGAVTRHADVRLALGLLDPEVSVEGFLYVGKPESLPPIVRPPASSIWTRCP